MQSFTYGNGIVHTLTRNVRGLPDRSLDAYGSTKFLDDGYDYDANGNVAAISDGATGRNQRGNRTMSYDGLDRLTAVQSDMYGSTGTAYGYDSLDNLVRVVAPGRNHHYCYDGNNRLTSIRTGGCTGTVVTSLGYDVQGNLASKAGVAYTFDQGNRLRSVNSPATSYLYDGHGRRFRDYTAASRYSVYSLAGQLLYANSLRGGEQEWYISLNGSLVAIRERDNASGEILTRYQHTDALGSPVVVTNESRGVVKRNEYEPYGKLVGDQIEDGPAYTGHMGDAATQLIYMQQRYYDPTIDGRFLSVDAVTPLNSGGTFNRYWYANGNSYRFTDPDGRKVAGIYSNENNALFLVDKDTRAWVFVEAESGGKPFGDPVPAGVYSILERAGRDQYYRLERQDYRFGDDATPEGRTNLRMHGPGRTLGCIEVCSTSEMAAVDRLIRNTSTTTTQVNDKSLVGRFTGRRESLRDFGTLHVLPSGMSLKFDSRSGQISIRWRATGSRIPKERKVCTVKDGVCK